MHPSGCIIPQRSLLAVTGKHPIEHLVDLCMGPFHNGHTGREVLASKEVQFVIAHISIKTFNYVVSHDFTKL